MRQIGSEARFVLTVALCLLLRSSNHPRISAVDKQVAHIYAAANAAFAKFDFTAAERLYDKGANVSHTLRDGLYEARFLFGKANCRASRLDFGRSVPSYLRAKAIAESERDSAMVAIIALTLSNVYGKMADRPTAVRYIREAAGLQVATLDAAHRVRISINLAIGCTLDHRPQDCTHTFRRAVDDAIDTGDLRILAYCRRMFGNHLLQLGDFDEAETSLNEALRLHLITRSNDVAFSYTSLAQLHLARHNPQLALVMADRALATAPADVQAPLQVIHHIRALARVALHDVSGAVSDFQDAIEYARTWRAAVVPTDSARTGSSVWLHNLYSDYIAAGMSMYVRTRNQPLAWELFEAAEENRAVSFRQKLLSHAKLPPRYWETLARLRNAERVSPAGRTAHAERMLDRLQLQLGEIEAQAGIIADTPVRHPHGEPENISSDKSLTHCRKLLGPEEALLSFHIGDKESYVWAFTPKTFEVHVLPGRAVIAAAVDRFRTVLVNRDQGADIPASSLYDTLFGQITPAVRNKQSWILVLDDVLFQTPFAALIDPQAGARGPKYLIEQHSIRILPALAMLGSPQVHRPRGFLLAVGDPVFNPADPRWTGPKPSPAPSLPLFLSAASVPASEALARLPGTDQEVRVCARTWHDAETSTVLLEGVHAGRNNVLDALARGPQIAHFATHVVQRDNSADDAELALALDSSGRPDFLAPAELSNRKFSIDLVTLSACNSGGGKTYPGAGLFGLTRAWLLAGARAVVATHWPMADDSGDLFQPFYSTLKSSRGVNSAAAAKALQTAQITMLRSESRHAQPGYWASFFVIGKD